MDIDLNTSSGNRDQFISAIAHETMHSVQYENGQGDASIFNEEEAYVQKIRAALVLALLHVRVGTVTIPDVHV